jgi:transcriptional regulator with XRE-family HTH domain
MWYIGAVSAIGDKIREMRQRRSMSQCRLAAKLGLGQAEVSKLETGACASPRVDLLARVAAALGCELKLTLKEKR